MWAASTATNTISQAADAPGIYCWRMKSGSAARKKQRRRDIYPARFADHSKGERST